MTPNGAKLDGKRIKNAIVSFKETKGVDYMKKISIAELIEYVYNYLDVTLTADDVLSFIESIDMRFHEYLLKSQKALSLDVIQAKTTELPPPPRANSPLVGSLSLEKRILPEEKQNILEKNLLDSVLTVEKLNALTTFSTNNPDSEFENNMAKLHLRMTYKILKKFSRAPNNQVAFNLDLNKRYRPVLPTYLALYKDYSNIQIKEIMYPRNVHNDSILLEVVIQTNEK